jgi:hypothetical protein
MLYTAFLVIHSYLRWVVLAAGVIALFRAIGGNRARRPWDAGDEAASRWFVISVDVQMLLGIVIYLFLSPFTMSGWSDMGETMRNAPLRFIVVEHQVGMLIAVALAHIGRGRIRKAADDARRHRTAAIFYGLALVAMLVSIPWPFMPAGRALFRGLGV